MFQNVEGLFNKMLNDPSDIQYIWYNIFYLNTVKVKLMQLMGPWHTEFIKTSQFLGNPYEPFTHQTFHNGLFWETDKMFVQ